MIYRFQQCSIVSRATKDTALGFSLRYLMQKLIDKLKISLLFKLMVFNYTFRTYLNTNTLFETKGHDKTKRSFLVEQGQSMA